MPQGFLHCEVLRHAADLAGGPDRLAERLAVGTADVRAWMRGNPPPPHGMVFAALALIECERVATGRSGTK